MDFPRRNSYKITARLLRLALNDNFSESRSLIVLYALDHPIHRGIYRAPLTSGESPISVIIKLQDSNFIFMTFNDEELCIVKWWVEIKNESELDSWKLQIDQRLTKNSYIIGKSLPKFPKISPNFDPHFNLVILTSSYFHPSQFFHPQFFTLVDELG